MNGSDDRPADAFAAINPEIYSGVVAILSKLTGFQPGAIQPAQCLGVDQTPCEGDPLGQAAPLGLDSLDLINVTMELEEKFDITITDDEQANPSLGRVSGLALFVERKVMEKAKEVGVFVPLPEHGEVFKDEFRRLGEGEKPESRDKEIVEAARLVAVALSEGLVDPALEEVVTRLQNACGIEAFMVPVPDPRAQVGRIVWGTQRGMVLYHDVKAGDFIRLTPGMRLVDDTRPPAPDS